MLLLFLMLSAGPGNFQEAVEAASEFSDHGKYQKAADTLRAALVDPAVLDAARGVALNNLGYAYRMLGRCEDATSSLARSLRLLNGPTPFAMTRRASVNYFSTLLECGDADRAAQFWTKTLEPMLRDPRVSAQDYAALSAAGGAAFLSQKQYAKAEPFFDNAIAILEYAGPAAADRLAVAHGNRGVARCFLGRTTEGMADAEAARKALGLLDRSVKATVLNDIGLCYFICHRFEEAEPYFENAVSLLENDESAAASVILANYADLLRKTGRKQAAKALDHRASKARGLPAAGRMTIDVGELSSFKE
jgi:tetratricopeptide (TPR) repeat protein